MPDFAPIQPAFSGGETSPEFAGRVDLPENRLALAYCRNWMVLPQGPLLRRMGTEFSRKLAGLPRLFDFRGANGQNHLLTIGAGAANIHTDSGDPVVAEAQDLIVNGGFAGGAGWTTVPRDGYLVFEDGGVAIKVLGSLGKPAVYQKITLSMPSILTVRVKMWWKGDIYANNPYPLIKIGTTVEGSQSYYKVFNLYTMQPRGGPLYHEGQTAVLPPGDYYVTLTTQSAWEDSPTTVFDDVEVITSEPEAGIVVPWTDEELPDVQVGYESGAPQSLFAHPTTPPWFIKNPAPGQWDYGDVVFSNIPYNTPGDAGSGLAWAGENWPGVVEVFNGRAYWAGLPSELNRIWATIVGTVSALLVGNEPDDAIDQRLAVKGIIRWLCGKRLLLMGTDIGEHVVTGSTGVPMPGDIRLQDESAFGSARVQARLIGDEVVYVSRDKRDVHAVSYSNDEVAWVSRALTFAARHMTQGGVKEIHFARSPFPCIVFVLHGGGLVACTYARREKVTAWWRIDVGAPVYSAAVIETDNGADLWLAVRREAAGVYLERLPLHEVGAQHLDSWVYVSGAEMSVPHLAGKQVAVLETNTQGRTSWDGQLYDVDVNGDVLGFADPDLAATYVIGLPFAAKATTLPVEGANPEGTSQGMKIHYSEITARIYDSARPLLNGTRAGKGRPYSAPADEVEPLTTGDVLVKSLKITAGGVIDIEANDPFRTQVCAVFGRASAGSV
jgi:hypothetical protein